MCTEPGFGPGCGVVKARILLVVAWHHSVRACSLDAQLGLAWALSNGCGSRLLTQFMLEVEERAGLSARLEPWRRDVYAPLVIEVRINLFRDGLLMPLA